MFGPVKLEIDRHEAAPLSLQLERHRQKTSAFERQLGRGDDLGHAAVVFARKASGGDEHVELAQRRRTRVEFYRPLADESRQAFPHDFLGGGNRFGRGVASC
jgi:hypothetical protein